MPLAFKKQGMRNRNTIEFLGVWEELYNPDFNCVQFEAVKKCGGIKLFCHDANKADYADEYHRYCFKSRAMWQYNSCRGWNW